MLVPVQAVPVTRTVRGLKPRRRISMASFDSCMIQCVNSALDTTGLSACSHLTSLSKYLSCALASLGEANQTSIAIAEASCFFSCAF